jgi:hypothetical protein
MAIVLAVLYLLAQAFFEPRLIAASVNAQRRYWTVNSHWVRRVLDLSQDSHSLNETPGKQIGIVIKLNISSSVVSGDHSYRSGDWAASWAGFGARLQTQRHILISQQKFGSSRNRVGEF